MDRHGRWAIINQNYCINNRIMIFYFFISFCFRWLISFIIFFPSIFFISVYFVLLSLTLFCFRWFRFVFVDFVSFCFASISLLT